MRITKLFIICIFLFLLSIQTIAKIGIVVNKDLYPSIENAITLYIADLAAVEGKDAWLDYTTFDDQNSPSVLKDSIVDHYNNDNLEGLVFVGDLPTVMYYDDGSYGLSDHYWMDMDGVWGGSNFNFNDHSGNIELEIWESRIVASVLEDRLGLTEVEIVNTYFAKVHDRMIGGFVADKSKVILGDSNTWGGLENENKEPFENIYSPINCYGRGQDTKENWISELESGHEYGYVYEHSSATAHSTSGGSTSIDDIIDADTDVRFLNSFACSNAKYSTANMVGVYALDDNGLLCIGSTNTGSMIMNSYDAYNDPLIEGKCFGEAFVDWANYVADKYSVDYNSDWHYGMNIQGIASLKLAPYNPTPINEGNKTSSLKSAFNFHVVNSKICYQIPDTYDKSNVRINLYNTKGALIKTLINELQEAGSHFISLKSIKSNLASGLYVCEMNIGTFKTSVKIVTK